MTYSINTDAVTQAPASKAAENKIHETAEKFVGTFFTQMVQEMYSEMQENSDEGYELDMYRSFMAEAMGEKIAESSSAKVFVDHIENKLRRQAGLNEIGNCAVYNNMHHLQNNKEGKNVWTSAA